MTAFLALVFALASGAAAHGAAPEADDRPRVRAAPAQAVAVDGRLDEAAWEAAEPAGDFVQFEPDEGAPAAFPTRVRVLYSADALYVGAEMEDPTPEAIRTLLSRRDDTGGADAFSVAIDAYDDDRTARLFGVTASGVQFDALVEGRGDDDSWDAVWFSAVRVTPQGWTAELRIPYSQLRFSGDEAAWGINFQRDVPRLGERSFWSPFTREDSNSGIVQFFGALDGIAGVRPRRLVQAVPYTLASGSRGEDPDAPGTASYGTGVDAGADVKLGLTPSVILDATVNPDFGQVDADPAELNLSTFETFFPERRPFFLEGTGIFDEGFSRDGALVYTRRIGGVAPIVAASKLTGRTARGLSFGALTAATGRDFSPNRLYGVGRLRQELGGQSYVGGTVALFDARGDATGASGAGARSGVASADWDVRFGPGEKYQAEGVVSGSLRNTADGTDRGLAVYAGVDQVRGARRFATGVRVFTPGYRNNDVGRFRETDRVSFNGALFNLWNGGDPFGPFRRLQTFAFSSAVWAYSDGTYRGANLGVRSFGQLRGFQDVRFGFSIDNAGGFDVRETRGLGPVSNLLGVGVGGSISTDTRRRFVAEVEGNVQVDAEGGLGLSPEVDVEWAASDRLRLSASGEIDIVRGLRAWVANEGLVLAPDGRLLLGASSADPADLLPDALVDSGLDAARAGALVSGLAPVPAALPGGTGFYAPLFGARDYNAADLTLRANVIFRPTLSLQLFTQLFAARGRYSDLRLLGGADDFRAFEDYPKRRDFARASLRSNAVLRWEYRPGSSLFVVWQRASGDDVFEEVLLDGAGASPYDATALSQFGDVLGAFADDVVLVKLSYLLWR